MEVDCYSTYRAVGEGSDLVDEEVGFFECAEVAHLRGATSDDVVIAAIHVPNDTWRRPRAGRLLRT